MYGVSNDDKECVKLLYMGDINVVVSNNLPIEVQMVVAKYGCDKYVSLLVDGGVCDVLLTILRRGKCVDELVGSSCIAVRKYIARKGLNKHLDILVNDIHPQVRLEVVNRGKVKYISALNSDVDTIVRDRAKHLIVLYNTPSKLSLCC